MKKKVKKIYLQSKRRSLKKIVGNLMKPRLSVFRSNSHIYTQLIDDKLGQTLVSCSTLDSEFKKTVDNLNACTQEAALAVGIELGKRALKKNIQTVVFDRGNRAYHGRIEKIAQGARQEGLIF